MTVQHRSRFSSPLPSNGNPEIATEQAYTDMLFARLDAEVAQSTERLRGVMKRVDAANPDAEALVERETEYHALNARLDRLNLAQLGLVFGRIDVRDPDAENPVPEFPELDRRYIGRMGLDAREDGYRTLLLDWRAPMARPFYLATTAQPEGVTVRRHIRTSGRTVTGIDDERLSVTPGTPESVLRSGVGSESALLPVLTAPRTGHMVDIVETIQREQDVIIRDRTRGVMVVEGGPGTGKTAVALHRVAWLLYTWREQLAATGVLIIGPNRTFLDYISRVLPELGETGVVLSTIGELYPGVSPEASDNLLTREIKGSEEMVTILAEAVKAHQTLPDAPVRIKVEGLDLLLTPTMVKKARTRARRSRRPHNLAQPVFREHLIEQLTDQLAEKIGADPLGGRNLLSGGDIAQLHEDLMEEPSVLATVDAYWPVLDPESVLNRLLSDRIAIATAAADYDDETRDALYREPGSPWTESDAALLDELAERLGMPDPDAAREAAEQKWREQVEDAQEALDILSSSASSDLDDGFEAEVLSAHDVIDAETLAERQRFRDTRTTAERARMDHTWAYGHVIVDEAQELSPMEWRMVMRRCPSRWMTLVGDTAQTGSPAGVDSWTDTLSPYVHSRFHRHELTVNYRTPRDISDVAAQLLPMIAPERTPATAIRDTGWGVRFLPDETDPTEVIRTLHDRSPERTSVLIAPDDAQVAGSVTVNAVKGLEFDHVVVLDPAAIVGQSPQGWQDLYVTYTRATQSLTVIGRPPHPVE
ncbi:helicase [Corynebacterium sp. CCM 9204]|uniref:HelD family protein n=1 Tax=Corynebacterium sp. CCM 9204 TaxID=3057616 RepID=UPI0035232BB4